MSAYCLPTVFLNGEYLPGSEARISPFDRGFLFGDAVYEVIPFYNSKPLRFVEHMRRLQNSLDGLAMKNPYTLAQWREYIGKLIHVNQGVNVGLYLQISRGVAKRDFTPPVDAEPTVFMMVSNLATPTRQSYEKGLACASLEDNRWLRCHIKSAALLGAVMLKHESNLAGADEPVLFRDGFLTESCASNVVVVKGNKMLCPPMDNLILAGCTYELMIELARKNGIEVELRRITREEVLDADELWMSSSTREVMAITSLDKVPVGHGEQAGKPGPLFWRMYDLLQENKEQLIAISDLLL